MGRFDFVSDLMKIFDCLVNNKNIVYKDKHRFRNKIINLFIMVIINKESNLKK